MIKSNRYMLASKGVKIKLKIISIRYAIRCLQCDD